MAKEIQAPNDIFPLSKILNLFLAGSIEMGKANMWQKQVVEAFKDYNIHILNPRRDDWDASWEQSITNPQFRQQVNWELDGLDFSDIVIMYFQPDTLSPITLQELGAYSKSLANRLLVICPKGYWKKGNVDIMCKRNKNIQFDTIEEAILHIKQRI